MTESFLFAPYANQSGGWKESCTALLLEVFDKIRRNKGSKTSGIDGISVKEFGKLLIANLCQIHEEQLQSGSYMPQAVKRVYIDKEDGGKRPLGIPNVKERTVQQALLNVLQPIFEPEFHPSNYGYRPNKSAHHAIAKFYERNSCSEL